MYSATNVAKSGRLGDLPDGGALEPAPGDAPNGSVDNLPAAGVNTINLKGISHMNAYPTE
jgi:hypothetical protein